MNNLVSVIIPVYNAEKTIEKCLDSLLNQSYKNTEIIVVNNGSSDRSLELIEEYKCRDDRIIALEKEEMGVSGARNIGINYSHGDYLVFVDADDYLEKDAIEKELSVIEQNNVDIVFFDYFIDDKEDIKKCIHKLKYGIYTHNKNTIIEQMTGGNDYFSSIWRGIYKADLIKNHIFFRRLKFAEDLLFNMECVEYAKRILICNEAYYHYVNQEASALEKIQFDIQNSIDFFGELGKCNYIDKLVFEKIYKEETVLLLNRILNNSYGYCHFKKWAKKINIISISKPSWILNELIKRKYLKVYLSLILKRIVK